MGRVTTTLLLALGLLGCNMFLPGDRVELLTGNGPFPPNPGPFDPVCYTSAAEGPLVVDPEYGTAIRGSPTGGTAPVMWPPGFIGRRVGSEVVVQDRAGNVVATTGGRYRLEGGYWSETITPTKENHYSFSGPRVFLACGSVDPS
jgi:hypothetical protein